MTGEASFVSFQSAFRRTDSSATNMSDRSATDLNEVLGGHGPNQHIVDTDEVRHQPIKTAVEQDERNLCFFDAAESIDVLLCRGY